MATLTSAPFLAVPSDTSPGEALGAITTAGLDLCLVGEVTAPITLVSREDLERLPGTPRHLGELLDFLPAAVLVENVTGISGAEAQVFALLLEDTRAPGLIVVGDEGVECVVAAAVVAEAITHAGPTRLFGVPDVTGPAFVCAKHHPPLYLYPRTGDQVPRCPGDPLHGRMKRADL
jgi:hypothetical protein